MRFSLTLGFCTAIGMLAVQTVPATAADPARAQAIITATPGNTVFGMLNLEQGEGGVRISGLVRGFSASTRHGFHVLETKDCKLEDARNPGVHFNPAGRNHGDPSRSNHHAGDLPNVDADAQGNAVIDITIMGVTLAAGETSLLNHAIGFTQRSDDYTTQPSGGSGPRIACGVIKPI